MASSGSTSNRVALLAFVTAAGMDTYPNNIGMVNGQPKQRSSLGLGHLLGIRGVNDLHSDLFAVKLAQVHCKEQHIGRHRGFQQGGGGGGV